MEFNKRVEVLKEMLNSSNGVAFFGGAGVSTASGIPDFRSKDGLYNQKDVRFEQYEPEYLLSHSCLHNEPKVFYEFYRQKLDCRNIEPNIVHRKLAQLEKDGILKGIITQNIDGLHQKAGSEKVYEIHGTTEKVYCNKCHKIYDKNYIFECKDDIPRCECGGLIRPDVVLYEEMLPAEPWDNAVKLLNTVDTLIVAGTSLVVTPAAHLLQYFFGGNLVIMNREETSSDKYAQLIFRENMEDVFKLL